ncbi:MAG TPA: hypothetical protein VLK34_00170 [Nocardioidaceae bacterium]|nr:hypothetical protein [Nocardioidaceae bacterium]
MPDLDRLLDTLVADVTAGTRAPGASTAIKQARRRRAQVAVAAVGAVAFIVAGGALAVGTHRDSDQPSPTTDPTTASPTTPRDSAEPTPISLPDLTASLHAILAQVPAWAITNIPPFPDDYDYAFNGPCSGNWGKGATSGSDGGVAEAGIGHAGFSSEAQASDAAARFVENLKSCTATAWRTRPIAQTGSVLALSSTGVAWIQQNGTDVQVLQVPTTDGPPPVGVQVEVTEWMVAYSTWQEQN